MTSTTLRSDLAVCGLAVDEHTRSSRAAHRDPAHRVGAEPCDDGHVLLGGVGTALPLVATSKYTVRNHRLLLDGVDVGLDVTPVARPHFYDLASVDGVPYAEIARLHSADVLAASVVAGSPTLAQLAEVAEVAVRLDGVHQMLLASGTSAGRDRGARHLTRCVEAILAAVPGLPIHVQLDPPAEPAVLDELKAAGVVSVGIHVESFDEEARRRYLPSKCGVPMSDYRAAWHCAVRVFGRNQVMTYLVVGMGEDPDELVAGAAELIDMGVYPFVVPFRPIGAASGVGADPADGPPTWLIADVTDRVAELLVSAGMRGIDQGAGCASCGACSALATAGG